MRFAISRLTHPSWLSSTKELEHQLNIVRLMHLDTAASVVPKGPRHNWRMEIVAITSFQLRRRSKEAKIKIILFSFEGAFRGKQHKWRLIFSPIDVAKDEGEGKLTLRFPHKRLRVLQHISRNRLKLFSVRRAFLHILRYSCHVLHLTSMSPLLAPNATKHCCEAEFLQSPRVTLTDASQMNQKFYNSPESFITHSIALCHILISM